MAETSELFDPTGVIAAKRDGHALSAADIDGFLDGYVSGRVADSQAAALCMAVFLRGFDDVELAAWTDAMIRSGDRLHWGPGPVTLDKHSTGGVGDKTSLVVAPLLAAAGARVPMLSGRGLGITGGTLDKLDAIPGFRTLAELGELRRWLDAAGCFIAGATSRLVPADAKLYALRDVTATVASEPLIASSIMSKKIAAGASALVLDVKHGSGAFCATVDEAASLARRMLAIAAAHDLPATAVLTAMSAPLGRAVGNAVEVAEAVEVLHGAGPADLRDLVLLLASEAARAGALRDRDGRPVGARRLERFLDDGAAAAVWERMVRAQGGDPAADLPRPAAQRTVTAERSALVATVDAGRIGRAAWLAGAGRATPAATVDPTAGVRLEAVAGSRVRAGQVLAAVTGSDPARVAAAAGEAAAAFVLTDRPEDLRASAAPTVLRGADL